MVLGYVPFHYLAFRVEGCLRFRVSRCFSVMGYCAGSVRVWFWELRKFMLFEPYRLSKSFGIGISKDPANCIAKQAAVCATPQLRILNDY